MVLPIDTIHNPNDQINAAITLHLSGNLEGAEKGYRSLIAQKINDHVVYGNLAAICLLTNRRQEAVEFLRKALKINPRYPEAYNNFGIAFEEQGKIDGAIKSYRRAIELNPCHMVAYSNLGSILQKQGKADEAIAVYHKLLKLKISDKEKEPENILYLAKLLLELEKIPEIYANSSEIDDFRLHVEKCLDEAIKHFEQKMKNIDVSRCEALIWTLFRIVPFYLAYQQKNDRDFMVRYSNLFSHILKTDMFERPHSSGRSSKIRIGIASELLKNHNGAIWAYEMVANLPKENYEFYSYSLNGKTDRMTAKFAELGTYRWLPFTETTFLSSLEIIRNDNLDILIIPDIGMTATSRILCLYRLARFQCTGLGHPVTSGSKNIDYYLSCELMESEQSDTHYSEKLIRLPNIGIYYEIPTVILKTTSPVSASGIPGKRNIYGSVQSLFKYLPEYDFVFPEIAKKDKNAFFLFIQGMQNCGTDIFKARLKHIFHTTGLNVEDYVKFLPRMSENDFMLLFERIDVNLDSIGWNGGYTTIRSLYMNCPVVTISGTFMRGKHSSAMLKRIGAEELIAKTLNDYIDIAVKLATERGFKNKVVDKIKMNKHLLFHDVKSIQFIDSFFHSLMKSS
ncbi:MAG: tetratricopeptide repeat protein [Planctomycetes bacterium]|nr:tetratricopeptide repeat protein [Planctomycetota bacterium]